MKQSNAAVRVLLSFCLVASFFSLVPTAGAAENLPSDQEYSDLLGVDGEGEPQDPLGETGDPEPNPNNDLDEVESPEAEPEPTAKALTLSEGTEATAAGVEVAAVGGTFTADGLNYKILTEEDGNNTVSLTGPWSYAGPTLSVPATATNSASGIAYKVTEITGSGLTNVVTLDLSQASNLKVLGAGGSGGTAAIFGTTQSKLTTVILPENSSLTTINAYAFYGNTKLTAFDFSKTPALAAIGASAFEGCTNLASSFVAPSSLASIGATAFKSCSKLTGIDFSSATNLASIGASAFDSCGAVTKIDGLQNTRLSTIGDSTFRHCGKSNGALSFSVAFPSTLTSIEQFAFEDMVTLAGADFSRASSLLTIGDNAFSNSNLSSLDLSGCTSLSSIGGSAFRASTPLAMCIKGEVAFPASLTTIGASAFANNWGITGIVFPEDSNLTTFGDSSFFGCGLEGVLEIPSKTTTIGASAFGYNSDLISKYSSELSGIDFSAVSNLSIGAKAFYDNDSLGQLVLSPGIQAIGAQAFGSKNGGLLKFVIFEGTPASLGSGVFYGNDWLMRLKFASDPAPTPVGWAADAFAGISDFGMVAYPEGAEGYIAGIFEAPYLDDWFFQPYGNPLSVTMSSPQNDAIISSEAAPTELVFTFTDTMIPVNPINTDEAATISMAPNAIDPTFDVTKSAYWKSTSTVLTVPLTSPLADGTYTMTLDGFFREIDLEELSDQEFSFTVSSAPVITSDDHAARTVGHASEFQVAATSAAPVTWTLENAPEGVSIDATGKLIFASTLAIDTYTFTVKATNAVGDDEQEFTLTISSSDVPVSEIRLDKDTLSLGVGESGALTATIFPGNATNKNVTWTSSDPSVATVDAQGKVTALKAGTATIAVTTEDGDLTASCAVTVTEKPNPGPTPNPDPKPDPKPLPNPDPKKNPIGPATGDSLPRVTFGITAIMGIAATTALLSRGSRKTATQRRK